MSARMIHQFPDHILKDDHANYKNYVDNPVINIGNAIFKANKLVLEKESIEDHINYKINNKSDKGSAKSNSKIYKGIILVNQDFLSWLNNDFLAKIRFIRDNHLVTLSGCRFFKEIDVFGIIDFEAKDIKYQELNEQTLAMEKYYFNNIIPKKFLRPVYIFGAGASAEYLPQGQDLLAMILNNDYGELENFLNEVFRVDRALPICTMPTINEVLDTIEIALEREDALIPTYKSERLRKIKKSMIIKMIQFFADNNELNEENNYIRFVKNIIEMLNKGEIEEVSFITLNYDLFLDNALIKEIGLENIEFGINFANDNKNKEKREKVFQKIRNPIKLIKYHGSLDWMYCPYCNKVYQKDIYRTLSRDRLQCNKDFTELDWLLYPPMQEKDFKNDIWMRLHSMTEDILRNADRVVFIGYSLSNEDALFRYKVKRSLYRIENPVDIVVVDKELKDEKRPTYVEKNYWHFFGPIDYRPIGFQAFSYEPY